MNPHNLLNRLQQKARFMNGLKVVSDEDVASMYGVTTGHLRRAIARHRARFPPEFMLEQKKRYFFTEGGILMVSSVLRNSEAAQISVSIIRELFNFNSN
jgi:hypothetical protein